MCVADWLSESFESPLLVEALAALAVVGTFLEPWSARSATLLLLHEQGSSARADSGESP